MRVLPANLVSDIQRFDKSLDVLWNNRIMRWIVVQKLPRLMRVSDTLRGCPVITGDRSQYKSLFVCEQDPPGEKRVPAGRGIPVIPSAGWITRRVHECCPSKQDNQFWNKDEELEQTRERETHAYVDDLVEDTVKELKAHAGLRKYGWGDEDALKRHSTVVDGLATKTETESVVAVAEE